ncbi:hypothetical protein ACFXGT_01560 [Streptomyces sp. NPDC059352]|uniref:hypothetical protein n=1 Tax=Streptomyces sp. NPDC059352 TaxID=3346810 RepID=UPI0036C77746
MIRSRLAAIGLVLVGCILLTACGDDPEVGKSISDIRTSVDNIRDEIKLESKAVDAGDARTEVESVKLVAQSEVENLRKYANRAPATTQEFADAAEAWAEAVATSRTAILEGSAESTSTLAFANERLSEKTMDSEAGELGIEPWLKLDEY